ncbi:GH12 family glycosyl hydrolase domain-containing protein [Amycolatopsis viridis]|uniref:Glycosyl hydrolase family 12 n=1 Tax=Amycolatopsis viridis TaxID=185678 RepID=A0ABX0SW27_9PSEU|nr:hypothetical protein [Amycolatopsis viridis]NIH80619.1 hypothetical protein [Amycolatopsis viridis]
MTRTTPAVLLAAVLVLLGTTACRPDGSSSAPPSPAATAAPAPGSAAVPGQSCTDPAFTTSDPDGGWSEGGYYVHNNMWNQGEAGPQTLSACSHGNWYVDSAQPATTSVKTYPNVHQDINDQDGAPLSTFPAIRSTFAGRGPGTGIYDVAYDLWLNGVGDGPGVTELMVWTENHGQVPDGSEVATYTADGVTYDVWRDEGYLAFVAQGTHYSGTVDLKAMIGWAIGAGHVPPNPTVNQIGYGIEFCSTDGKPARFTVTDFSVALS